MRKYSLTDKILINLNTALATSFGSLLHSGRANPAQDLEEGALSEDEKRHSASLMRVNHAGEVCAQALYSGQAMTARSRAVATKLSESAQEEADHLAWCQQRLNELSSHPSYFSGLWYAGAFGLGLLAGAAGDRWSLGFLAETEKQVAKHLEGHLQRISPLDKKSIAIIHQMQTEELSHQHAAQELGAKELPMLIKRVMHWSSKIMTTVAHYL